MSLKPVGLVRDLLSVAVALSVASPGIAQQLNSPQVAAEPAWAAGTGQSILIASQDNGVKRETAAPSAALTPFDGPDFNVDSLPDDFIQDLPPSMSVEQQSSPAAVPRSLPVAPPAVSKAAELLQQRGDDGKLKQERWVAEDAEGNLVNHGEFKEYGPQGAVIRSGHYHLGLQDGVWRQTVSPAAVQSLGARVDQGFRQPFSSQATFVQGRLHGEWTVTDASGKSLLIWSYEDDVRHGPSVWFNSRGVKAQEIQYQQGTPDGPAMQWANNQREPQALVYHQGRLLKTRSGWYDTERRTRKRIEEVVLEADADKVVAHDWWNSSITTHPIAAGDATRHGGFQAWYANSQSAVQGQFQNGQSHGDFRWWFSSGQAMCEGTYWQGQPSGQWTWWYPNGMKLMQGSYDDGQAIGTWSKWADDGQLVQRSEADQFPTIYQDLLPDEVDTGTTLQSTVRSQPLVAESVRPQRAAAANSTPTRQAAAASTPPLRRATTTARSVRR